VSRAVRSVVLAFIGLGVVAALSSCGSSNGATSSDQRSQNRAESRHLGQTASGRNWYRVASIPIAEADWGRVRAAQGLLEFTLGPNLDRRRRHELNFPRVVFTAARITVADDQRGKNLVRLLGQPAAGCLFHAQGDGVNVIIATRGCVPMWATTDHRTHARMWIRVQNLAPHPRIVYLEWEAMTA
jgi:hypothetical protein